MTRQKFYHVYDLDDDRKYLGFFLTREDAATWMKRQKSPRNLLATNEPPPKRVANELTCENPECPEAGRCGGECARNFSARTTPTLVDAGLDAAIAATKAEEAQDGPEPSDTPAG